MTDEPEQDEFFLEDPDGFDRIAVPKWLYTLMVLKDLRIRRLEDAAAEVKESLLILLTHIGNLQDKSAGRGSHDPHS